MGSADGALRFNCAQDHKRSLRRNASDSKAARRRFVVKWIRPKEDARRYQRIESTLSGRGYTPVVIEYASARSFLAKLGRDRIDMLLVSGRSVSAAGFEAMIAKATKRYPFDVIYYDTAPARPTRARLSLYSTVRIVAGRHLAGAVADAADAAPSKWRDPRFVRGLVISRSVDMEATIDRYIADHLTSGKRLDASTRQQIYSTMYDYAFALRTKQLILKMIMLANGDANVPVLKLIDSIARSRNRLAHAWLGVDDKGTVVSSHAKDPRVPDREFDKVGLWKMLQKIDSVILYFDSASKKGHARS